LSMINTEAKRLEEMIDEIVDLRRRMDDGD